MWEITDIDLVYDEVEENMDEMWDSSSDEILVQCLNQLGRVDLREMSQKSGKSYKELVLDLRGSAIFQDPAEFQDDEQWNIEKGWLTRAQYCSGNIHKKLQLAEKMNRRFRGCFDENIEALEKMLSTPISLDEIYISPGAPWIPSSVYALFVKNLFNLKTAPSVIFSKSCWKIVVPKEVKESIENNSLYGTTRMSAITILEQTMNSKTVKVYDYTLGYGWNYERTLNRVATLMAQEKQKAIILEFDKWVRENEERRAQLEDCYNEMFAGYAMSSYDGSFLKFPDLNPKVLFYLHQKNAIARMLLSPGNLLLAHDVGTGKTYEICAGVHEMYRMNLSKKNLVVVPNNVLQATVDAHKYLYPKDKILAIFPEDFTPERRNKLLETVRDGDFVAVYMAYSSFDMIVMSKEYWTNKMKRELQSIRREIAYAEHKAQKGLLQRREKALAKKLSTHVLEAVDTPWLSFEQLGIQTLVVDEAHNYKNIPLNTKTDNIVGMHTVGSKKCKEMLEKAHSVDKLIFATGTPITNSLADLFVLQTYLQPEELKFRGIDTFDMWVNTFGERETNFEVDVDSKNLRAITRFSTFHNLAELMAMFSTVCDFYHTEGDKAELPTFEGYIDVCVPRNQGQTEYIKEISERVELIREHKVSRTEDNLLKVTTDGRKCALDIRLVDSVYNLSESEKSKIEACAQQVYEVYCREPNTCQVIFSDIGTPKNSFNVYDGVKEHLMKYGILESEIAFVHDATNDSARTKLFAAVNRSTIRVIIGSTQKLGVGVNIQERLVALHHLSVPWRTADMVQREGRIIRQGNRCEKVYIYRYITEGTFDAYLWQLLENKQRFISSFLAGASKTRDMDDVAELILKYAEIKAVAIGNPLIRKRVETANLLERTRISHRQRQKQLIDLRTMVENVPTKIGRLQKNRALVIKDIALYKDSKEVIHRDERLAFGEELLEALQENHMQQSEQLFDCYQGFDVVLPANMNWEKSYIYVRSSNGSVYYVDMKTEKPLGCAMRIDRLLESFPEQVEKIDKQIERTKKQKEVALSDIERGNIYEEKVEELELELEDIDKQLEEESIDENAK